jgi:LuxR family maltose regulon positive regulatory protein
MSAVPAMLRRPQIEHIPSAPRAGLLTTKLCAPRLRPNLVARPRLLEAISVADSALTVLCAPAGYGKSTLVTQWLIDAGIPIAWVSLDAYDNDLQDFFSLIVSAIQSIDRDIAAGTWQLLNNSTPPSGEALARSLIEEVSITTRPFALVLDDYHLINASEIHSAMATMLQNLPEALRVFIISRTDPPLPLARLRSQKELLELGQDDLQFSDDEALALLQRFDGLEVTPGEVSTLNDRTEGWVAGLQLISHVLRGHPPDRIRRFAVEFSGSVRSIEKYLWEEVIEGQPPEVQSFLLRTSILSQFAAPLCDAICESSDSAATIRQLEKERLFLVSLDDVGQWYRYHHLFGDVLRDRLAEELSEAELAGLHRRAAAWLEEQDFIEDAARHAVAGRDWERAIRLVEGIGFELYEQDRITALCKWLQGLPNEILERSPRLAFWLAYALTRLGRFDQAVQPLRIVEQGWEGDADPIDFASLRILQSFRSLADDLPRSSDFARDALALLPDDRPDDQAMAYLMLALSHMVRGECAEAEQAFANVRVKADIGHRIWIEFVEMAGSGGVLIQQGKLPQAAILFRRVLKLADEQYAIPSQQAMCRLGEIYLEWNDLDEAERLFLRTDAICEQTRSILWRSEVCLGLAKVAWARSEFETAFDEVERALDFGNQAGLLIQVRYARAHQARFWLTAGQLALARRWADSSDLDPYLPPRHERIFEHLTFVRLLIAEDQSSAALKILKAIGDAAREKGRTGDLIEVLALQALAYKQDGEHAEALDNLEQALAAGDQAGYVRIFVDEGEAIAPLLRHVSTRGARRDYAQKLLAAIDGSEPPPSYSKSETVDALSEREVEVLRLVSAGLPNRDIGQHLFISEKTVKKHLSNILGKLEATNRTQAVDQARRIGLL